MAEGLVFDIKANVNEAIRALQRVESELGRAGKAADTADKSFKKISNAGGQATQVFTNFGRIASDLPYGLIGVANNITPLIESFQQLSQKAKATGTSITSNLIAALRGGGGLVLAISLATAAAQFAVLGFDRLLNKKKETSKATKELKSDLEQIGAGLAKEYYQVTQLVTALQRQTLSREEQIKVQKELVKIAPEFFSNLDKEKDKVQALANAYFLYQNALTQSFRTKAKEKELIKQSEELLRIEQQILRIEEISKKTGTQKGKVLLQNEKGQIETINTLLVARFEQQQKYAEISKEINFSQTEFGRRVLASTEKVKKLKEEFFEFTKLQEIEPLSKLPKLQPKVPERQPGEGGVQQTQGQALDAARRLDFLIKSIKFDKQIAQAAELQSIIDGGINSGIDQFFNALANNQNPFDALIQGVKRLIVELISAVAKALILKALTSGLTAGTSNLSGIAKIAGRATLLGGGVPHFATGGFVSQPTMATIAENGPEFVLRPDQLGAIMNMGGGSELIPEMRFRGEDLFIMFNRVQKRRGRNF